MTLTILTQPSSSETRIVPFQPEVSLECLLDILERHAAADDPVSIQLSERGVALINAGMRAEEEDPLQDAEVRNQLYLLSSAVHRAPPLHPFAQELQACLDRLPPEYTVLTDPLAIVQHLLSEQGEMRVNYERRLQTIFNNFTENLSIAHHEAEAQSEQLVQTTSARIEEQNVIHAQDLTNLRSTHREDMNLVNGRLNDAHARINNVEGQLAQSQQTCAQLQGRLNQVLPEIERMRQELSQRTCIGSEHHCTII